MRFKRILCAVDFSEDALAAVEAAAELARSSRAKLLLFHSLEVQPVYQGWTLEDQLGEITLQLEESAKQSMESLLEDTPELEDLDLETRIQTGRALWNIIEQAKEWQADLIVMGAVGTAGLEHYIVGSTVERVIKNAPCSVLVIRTAVSTESAPDRSDGGR